MRSRPDALCVPIAGGYPALNDKPADETEHEMACPIEARPSVLTLRLKFLRRRQV